MRRLPIILILLACGCEVKPMPADRLFAFSTPKLKANIPGYGTWEIPTDFAGKLELQNPDGTKLLIRIASRAAKVIEAEGVRAEAVEEQRVADIDRAIKQDEIHSAERIEIIKGLFGIVQAALAAKAAPVDGTGPAVGPVLVP